MSDYDDLHHAELPALNEGISQPQTSKDPMNPEVPCQTPVRQKRKLCVDLPALIIRLVGREGRVTTTDVLSTPFASIRQLVFPGELKVEIERRDGTSLVLRQLTGPDWTPDEQRVLEESSAAGVVSKSQKMYDYDLATEKQDGTVLNARIMRVLDLHGFLGLAKTSSGREGEFFIYKDEARSIEFK